MKSIHYGSTTYSKEKFKSIKNVGWVKPEGGLWSSPVDSDYGWKDWCRDEDFRGCNVFNSFTFELNKDSKVLVINNAIDLEDAIKRFNYNNEYELLDYEKLSEEYDAIHLTSDGQVNTRFSRPGLYGWDCETLLVLNANAIAGE